MHYIREVTLQNITNNEVWFLKEGDLIVLEAVEDDNQLFRSSDGELIVATSEGRFEVHKLYYYLSAMSIGYVYTDNEKNEIYTFNSANGKLIRIESTLDNSSITVHYMDRADQFPVTFYHSNGKRMNITYTDGGLINSVDILGEDEEIESTR